jgi:Alr-MurF fusion protein
MKYTTADIASIVQGKFLQQGKDSIIKHLLYDSRRVVHAETSLFFALNNGNADGHKFIEDAYKKGIRSFIVSKQVELSSLQEANVILVDNTLEALQQLAAHHRKQFTIPVIGITGSNGKTVVKEWLYQLLKDDYNIVRSPKSYNSQIGVALSVWEMSYENNLAIFEGGISQPGEMERLERIIQPTIGVLTNIGNAHDAGFTSHQQKLQEKLKLFKESDMVIGQAELMNGIDKNRCFTWSKDADAEVRIISIKKSKNSTEIKASFQGYEIFVTIPFTDDASVENAITCLCVLLHLKTNEHTIKERFSRLHVVDMRLQLKHAINNCLLINDSYSADITSLKIALDFLQQQSSGLKRTVILSEFAESGKHIEEVYRDIAFLLKQYSVQKVILIGEEAVKHTSNHLDASIKSQNYLSTHDFITEFRSSQFSNEIILIKGARAFELERIVALFEKKVHQTVLQINLNALVHNLKEYQKLLQPQTKMMAMVKAFSYGSGGAEIASVLQYHNVHYLGVAYADEGVELVKSGIRIPIMVMNAESTSFQSIIEYNLQPVIYSSELLHQFENYLNEQGLKDYPVHIEVETGMHRLGFALEEMNSLAEHLSTTTVLSIQSVFSHLASSEDPSQDDFTEQQAKTFNEAVAILQSKISYPFLKHIANSAAVLRHQQLHYDMVRLGIGLYGVETVEHPSLRLQAVASLRSTVAQIKHLKKGESVSYNRRWIAERDSVIATIRVGYADGYSRRLGNGVGKMWVEGKLAPVVGSVCMDMTMIDITDIFGVKEGDEVILFGEELPLQHIANWMNTIPYEVMTSISHRVKRIYYQE